MKQGLAVFLQIVVVLIGFGALVVMLWMPQIEGRNVHATLFDIYFKDPFLAYAYVASVPFFVALYQAFKVLGYAGRGMVFTPTAVTAVRAIKYCALALIGFVAMGLIFILFAESDDRAGGVAIGIFFIVASAALAAAAAMIEQILQDAVDLRTENDLLRGRH